MDIVKLYQDYNIPFMEQGHKHCRPGWVQIECPFCTGNPGYHLGYNLSGDYYVCWRCGWHSTKEVIAKILNIPLKQVGSVLRTYKGKVEQKLEPAHIGKKKFELPSNTKELTMSHKKYLHGRHFSVHYLQENFRIQGTGLYSVLDTIDYSRRIIIPVYWQGNIVTFQARDITNKASLRYIACPTEREIIHHKYVLYGHPETFFSDSIIVCEGVFDVWRFGIGAVCTFGIKYTSEQIRELSKFKNILIIFDEDIQAQKQANKLKSELLFRGVNAKTLVIEDDPGNMSQEQANHIKANFLG